MNDQTYFMKNILEEKIWKLYLTFEGEYFRWRDGRESLPNKCYIMLKNWIGLLW